MTFGNANPLWTKLRSGELAIGTHVFSPDPNHTEILGHAGLDFALIDTEHAALSIGHVVEHIRAANATGISPIVRVTPMSNTAQLLDAGARALVFPHFGRDIDQTAAAIAALRYAPSGSRPTCTGVRATSYGLASFEEYVAQANEEILAIGLVEDASVIDGLGELMRSTRLDAVIPGTADLATSLGLHGQQSHPEVVDAVGRIVGAARENEGVKVGLYASDVDAAKKLSELDPDFLLYSIDYRVLGRAYADAASALREVLS